MMIMVQGTAPATNNLSSQNVSSNKKKNNQLDLRELLNIESAIADIPASSINANNSCFVSIPRLKGLLFDQQGRRYSIKDGFVMSNIATGKRSWISDEQHNRTSSASFDDV